MKNYFILSVTILLAGCGAGEVVNPTPQQYTVESTSTSPFPGTLENYQLAAEYSPDLLAQAVNEKICLPDTPADICAQNQANLASDFNFNLTQVSNGYSVSAYSLQYNTPGVYGENRSVSGGVLIPNTNGAPIKGVVLYFHATEVAKNDVPSCFTQAQANLHYCLNSAGADYGELLGGVLSSQGYIVIMPDYIGQGFDEVVMHDYAAFAKVEATNGLNMLTATKALLNKISVNNITPNLYVTGFSEGGSYSLWASNILQNTPNNFLTTNGLNLKTTVGLSGAYDLINAQLPMESDNVKVGDKYNIGSALIAGTAKPVLIGYLLSAYGYYNLNQDYTSLMQPAFLKCRTCLISGNSYTVPDLFTTYGNPDLTAININSYLISAAGITGYMVNDDNSAKALVQSGLWEDEAFLGAMGDNSIVSWHSNTPVEFVYLNKDSVVTNLNSINAYNGLDNNAKQAIVIDTAKYQFANRLNNESQVKPIDHSQSSVFVLVAALNIFNQYP